MAIQGTLGNSLIVFGLVALSAAAGCAFDPERDSNRRGLRDGTPLNDTPQNTMIRFQHAYEDMDGTEYPRLFTADFRFMFSGETDPLLVQKYGTNWGKDDETSSAEHLFDGFVDEMGQSQPAAIDIQMTLNPNNPVDDGAHSGPPDSTAFYKTLIVPNLHLEIQTPTSPEPTTYVIDGRYQFWLVRGDAAVLSPGQEARTDRWYIYRWEDQTATPAPGTVRTQASGDFGRVVSQVSTWGGTKDQYGF
jgi:hypothetical protein